MITCLCDKCGTEGARRISWACGLSGDPIAQSPVTKFVDLCHNCEFLATKMLEEVRTKMTDKKSREMFAMQATAR